jgi:hypothetical protein
MLGGGFGPPFHHHPLLTLDLLKKGSLLSSHNFTTDRMHIFHLLYQNINTFCMNRTLGWSVAYTNISFLHTVRITVQQDNSVVPCVGWNASVTQHKSKLFPNSAFLSRSPPPPTLQKKLLTITAFSVNIKYTKRTETNSVCIFIVIH